MLQHRIERAAREMFGWKTLRAGQLQGISSVLHGRDTLVVMPTGSGKSAIYQIAGRLLGGLTVVVSPLIALQHDQRKGMLESATGASALTLNSTLTVGERAELFESLRAGRVDCLFLAPEQLANPDVLMEIEQAKASLFVVDEAHCISSWGHDFRPDYLALGAAIERLGHPTVLALTATAAPPVRAEIMERLHLQNAAVVLAGFDRPNLFLAVRSFLEPDDQRAAVIQAVNESSKPGIVYTATRRQTEELAEQMRGNGIDAQPYHAGLKAADRAQRQDAFLKGDLQVVVATTAFGMGIDKPDVRFVLHAAIADSLDSYYQEIGRAGRDGEPARAVLFYRPQDLGVRRFFASTTADEDVIATVHRAVRCSAEPARRADVAADTTLTAASVGRALSLLDQAGAVTTEDDKVSCTDDRPTSTATRQAVQVADARRRYEESRLEMMREYAETTACRRALLLSYFGDTPGGICGNCDNCHSGTADRSRHRPQDSPFPLGGVVEHAEFGVGTVIRYEGDRIVVLFDQEGYRTLSLRAVAQRHLLASVGEPTAGG